MYVILTVPIITPAAILIQFQLMRIITHSHRAYDQTDDGDDDSDNEDENALTYSADNAKPPPSPLCIEVVVSDSSAESTPEQSAREIDKTLTQRSTSSQSPLLEDESAPLLTSISSPSLSPSTSPTFGGGSLMFPSPTADDIAAMNIVHFTDKSIDIDDDDDVVGHSMSPPLSTSRLWMFWSAAITTGEWRLSSRQWLSTVDQSPVVCI